MMEVNKKKYYEVGDVVLAESMDIGYKRNTKDKSKFKTNLFLIIYSEKDDILTMHKKNYACLKITTSVVDESLYNTKYDTNVNTFLDREGFISCSKIHTISDDQILGHLGTIDSYTLSVCYKLFHRFQNEVDRQILDNIY